MTSALCCRRWRPPDALAERRLIRLLSSPRCASMLLRVRVAGAHAVPEIVAPCHIVVILESSAKILRRSLVQHCAASAMLMRSCTMLAACDPIPGPSGR